MRCAALLSELASLSQCLSPCSMWFLGAVRAEAAQ